MILGLTRCCGVLEIDGLSLHRSPKQALSEVAYYFLKPGDMKVPFIYFTGVTVNQEALDGGKIGHAGSSRTDNYGATFAKFIEDNDLGTIVESDEKRNWSGNMLKMWIWQVNFDKTVDYLKREKLDGHSRS